MSDDLQRLDTHTEDGSSQDLAPPGAWLLYVGSAEDGFAHAGRSFDLADLTKVRFGRSPKPGQLDHEVTDGVLYLGVPIGWVSGVHCELRISQRTCAPEFDLQDLHSRNGTHIEGEPVMAATRLQPGAVFEVGRSFWMVRIASGPVAEGMGRRTPPLGLDTISPSMRHVAVALERLAPTAVSILVQGETGTGKETLARRVHDTSGRGGDFVRAHLGAFSGTRLESLLFGSDVGGGTLLERARGGTLFLENVGELSDEAQLKLLSAVTDVLPGYDVRLVCSSVGDLRELTARGEFRGDLYSLIAGFEVTLPSLRERREDLGTLVAGLGGTVQAGKLPITSRAFRRVLSDRWPFNLRQLSQTLTAASILATEGGTITREVLDEVLRGSDDMPDAPEDVRELRERLIRELTDHGGDVEAVATALGRRRQEVDQWLTRFDLTPGPYRH